MKNLKFLCIALCLLLLATLFVACNDDSESETTPDTQAITSEATEAVADGTQASTQGTETSALVETSVATENQATSETQVETLAETQAETTAQDIPFSTEVENDFYHLAFANNLSMVHSQVNSRGMLLSETYLNLTEGLHPFSTFSYVYDDDGVLIAITYTNVLGRYMGSIYLNADGTEIDGDSYIELYPNGVLKKRSLYLGGQVWLCEYDHLGRRTHERLNGFDRTWYYSEQTPAIYQPESMSDGTTLFSLTYENSLPTSMTPAQDSEAEGYIIEYDENGNIKSLNSTSRHPNDPLTIYRRDENGRIEAIFCAHNRNYMYYPYEYDDNGNIIRVSRKYVTEGIEEQRVVCVYTYTYENNLRIGAEHFTYMNEELSSHIVVVYTYDENGNFIESTSTQIPAEVVTDVTTET